MIVGIDEVNFSPSLAGDCVVCALARRPGTRKIRGVRDSKQLMPKQRLELFGELQETSIYSIVPATVNEINCSGIYEARNHAIILAGKSIIMKLLNMRILGRSTRVIIDGHFSKHWMTIFHGEFSHIDSECLFFTNSDEIRTECLVGGDEKVYEIGAASIVARVYCDALFAGFGRFYPGYRMEKNHGSPDEKMYEAIRFHGPTPYHRVGEYAKEWWKKILGEEGK